MKPKASDLELEADQIVTAAVEIFRESGLEAVSMRSVSSRLGVSPVPLYSRVGNKESLVEAIADRVLGNPAPPVREGEDWAAYAVRWAKALRNRLRLTRDSRLMVPLDRAGYVEASRPLVEVMRSAGMTHDAAVQACRLVMWATVGFATVESGASQRLGPKGGKRLRAGGDPTGVDRREIDLLFDMHVRYLIEGIRSDQTERGTAR